MKEQWKENSNPLKHKGFQLVNVAGNGNVLKQMICRKYNVDVLSNSGKRKRKKKRKSVKSVAGKSLVEGEKENRKMIIEIALLMINWITPEQNPNKIKGFATSPTRVVAV